jgi:purine-binding chemotaxis protein CheW
MPTIQLAAAPGHTASATGAALRSTLVFGLGSEEYAIDIGLVQELRGYSQVTRLADAPHWLPGVIHLRGAIVPLMDLRLRYGHADVSYNDSTVVVILALPDRHAGIVVDRVADVVQLSAEQLKPAPALPPHADLPPITAIGCVDDRLLAVLDMPALLRQLDAPINALAA